jgi:hypothetical protein
MCLIYALVCFDSHSVWLCAQLLVDLVHLHLGLSSTVHCALSFGLEPVGPLQSHASLRNRAQLCCSGNCALSFDLSFDSCFLLFPFFVRSFVFVTIKEYKFHSFTVVSGESSRID